MSNDSELARRLLQLVREGKSEPLTDAEIAELEAVGDPRPWIPKPIGMRESPRDDH